VEWLHALLRWIHVVAGIMWIGDSLLFMWLDTHLHPDPQSRKDVAGVTWLIHGGGYYQVEKRWLAPGGLPPRLRWFWLEATSTWLSGVLLLIIVYYMGARALMIDPATARLSASEATAVGLGLLLAGWLIYDGLWRALGDRPGLAALLSVLALIAVCFGTTRLLSPRAAFLHVGAMLGTIMAANVWVHIIPPQRRMVRQAREGQAVDLSLGAAAKTRSTHNSYITLPLIFLMISHHFPGIYSGPHNWVVLLLLLAAGAGVRHATLVGWQHARWTAAGVGAAVVALVVLTRPPAPVVMSGPAPSFAQVRAIVATRCATCHSQTPTEPGVTSAAGGVALDTPAQMRASAARIKVRVVEQRTMPLGNTTGMTDEERAVLGRWVEAGAPVR
jgi:uncharacterized membrane protein